MRVLGEEETFNVMKCEACGAAFSTGGIMERPFESEEYVGQFEELEKAPYSW